MVRVDAPRRCSSNWVGFRVLLEVCVILNTYIYSGGAGVCESNLSDAVYDKVTISSITGAILSAGFGSFPGNRPDPGRGDFLELPNPHWNGSSYTTLWESVGVLSIGKSGFRFSNSDFPINIYSTDRENEISKIFIIYLYPGIERGKGALAVLKNTAR